MEELRIVLLGKQGSGKSSAGNTLLGRKPFHTAASSHRVTTYCSMSTCTIDGHKISVVDTPGWTDLILMDDITSEIAEWIDQSNPGPHVFLLMLPIGRFTKEEIETVQQILEVFGEEACKYTMVLFTKGDDLDDKTIEEYLEDNHPDLKKILQDCGGRYHVLNNRDKKNHKQVSELLEKIKLMVKGNKGKYYTKEMFEKTAVQTERKYKKEKLIKQVREEVEKQMSISAGSAYDDVMSRSNQNSGRCSYCKNLYFEQAGSSADEPEIRSSVINEIKDEVKMQLLPEVERWINNMQQVMFDGNTKLVEELQLLREVCNKVEQVQKQVEALKEGLESIKCPSSPV